MMDIKDWMEKELLDDFKNDRHYFRRVDDVRLVKLIKAAIKVSGVTTLKERYNIRKWARELACSWRVTSDGH